MYLIEAGLICPRYNHIKTTNKIAQNGSQRLVRYALVCLMPCFGVSCPALAGSGILLVSSGWLWLCYGMSQCYPLGILLVILWLALAGSGMSHGVLWYVSLLAMP